MELEKKVKELPKDIREQIKKTKRGLKRASGLKKRMDKLIAISDSVWDDAVAQEEAQGLLDDEK